VHEVKVHVDVQLQLHSIPTSALGGGGQFHALATLFLYTQNMRCMGSTASQDTGEVKNLLAQMKHPAILITCNSLNTKPGILCTLFFSFVLNIW